MTMHPPEYKSRGWYREDEFGHIFINPDRAHNPQYMTRFQLQSEVELLRAVLDDVYSAITLGMSTLMEVEEDIGSMDENQEKQAEELKGTRHHFEGTIIGIREAIPKYSERDKEDNGD